MEKQEFLESQPLPDELVEDAWERSNGDPEEARELLSPSRLTVKGHFSTTEDNISGLYMLTWDYRANTIDNFRCVMVNGTLDEFQLDAPHNEFLSKLRELEESDQLMSGYTEELEEAIRALWTGDELDVSKFQDEEEFSELLEIHRQLMDGLFDFEDPKLEHEYELTRLINDLDDTEGEADEDDEESVTVPSCDVHVTPVQGVSVTKLQPGDMIYVEIGEIPEEWAKLKPVLEDLRDESGLIPAQLRSKKHTDDGRLELEVQFGKKVYGALSCGRDVSLMVPDETREKYGEEPSDALEELFQPKYIFPALGAALALILLVFYLL